MRLSLPGEAVLHERPWCRPPPGIRRNSGGSLTARRRLYRGRGFLHPGLLGPRSGKRQQGYGARQEPWEVREHAPQVVIPEGYDCLTSLSFSLLPPDETAD